MTQSIKKIRPGFAAIDIGATAYYVAVANQDVRQFETFTSSVREVVEYLREQQVQWVAMEATGIYWIPLHDQLDTNGFKVTVFNGAYARNVPGRKTDVSDCQWHAMLHSHGLLQACYIPPAEFRKLRTYYRVREDHLESATSCVQQMQKSLDVMNIRLQHVISQIHGVSGLRVIDAILSGERDPYRLAALCDGQILKSKKENVIASLEGTWEEHHLFALRQALQGYRFFQEQMVACDKEIARLLQELNHGKPPGQKKTNKVVRHNPPRIDDLHGEMVKLCGGIDPTVLPGISPLVVLKLVGEIGTDLKVWPTEKHFTSWLGLAPTRHQSGKQRRRIRRRKTLAGQIFKEAVMGIAKTKDTALGGFYRRIKGSKGAAVANTATARKLAEMYYRLMTQGTEYIEEGLKKYEDQYREQSVRHLNKLAKRLGFRIEEKASPATV